MLLDQKTIDDLEKIGAGYVKSYRPWEYVSSGSLKLDYALGIGWPRGLFSTITGDFGCGKSSMCLLTAINVKQSGGKVAWLDIENRFNQQYAFKSGLGKPNEDYAIFHPQDAESALETMRKLAAEDFDLCVLDSIAELVPQTERNASLTEMQMGLLPRLMAKFFRVATDDIAISNMAVIMTNQVRASMSQYQPVIRPGGKAKDAMGSIAMDLYKPTYEYQFKPEKKKKGETGDKDDNKKAHSLIGITTNGHTYKNICAQNERPVKIPMRMLPGLHINLVQEIMDFGRAYKVLTKSDGTPILSTSAKWYYNGEALGSGALEVSQALREDIDMRDAIERDIRAVMASGEQIQNGSEKEKEDGSNTD